jgi:hypothetical protein
MYGAITPLFVTLCLILFWLRILFLLASLLKYVSAAAFIPYLSLLCSVFEISFLNHASCNIFLPVNVYRTLSFQPCF